MYQIIPRYFLEICLITGLACLVFLWPSDKQTYLFSILGVLVGAGYRVLPSVNNILIILSAFRQTFSPLKLIRSAVESYNFGFTEIGIHFPSRKGNKLKFSGSLKFEDVNFAYQDGKNLFKNLNIEIPEKSSLLIQGPSGSGKTTFLGLASGLIVPNSGTVTMRSSLDADFHQINHLVTGIGYLGANSALFADSVLFNITLSYEDEVDLSRVHEVIESVGLRDRILNSNLGLRNSIGENGISLSTGERKRLGLARILYAQNPLIILDEPTANLDTELESLVWNVLQKVRTKCTLLIVSHRTVPQNLFDSRLDLTRTGR